MPHAVRDIARQSAYWGIDRHQLRHLRLGYRLDDRLPGQHGFPAHPQQRRIHRRHQSRDDGAHQSVNPRLPDRVPGQRRSPVPVRGTSAAVNTKYGMMASTAPATSCSIFRPHADRKRAHPLRGASFGVGCGPLKRNPTSCGVSLHCGAAECDRAGTVVCSRDLRRNYSATAHADGERSGAMSTRPTCTETRVPRLAKVDRR